jgi:hypothetical protein
LFLLVGELDPLLLFKPADGPLDIDLDRAAVSSDKQPEAAGACRLRRVQRLEVDGLEAVAERLDDHMLGPGEVVDRLVDDGARSSRYPVSRRPHPRHRRIRGGSCPCAHRFKVGGSVREMLEDLYPASRHLGGDRMDRTAAPRLDPLHQ